jgi:membrane fusion protein (multidrug efflux system)
MIKRLVIVAALLAVLLGGLAYFQLVLKPEMIKGFIAKAPKPPVTVTTALAEEQSWVTRSTSIGTLTAFQGIDVSSQVAGIVATINMDSGQVVQQGADILELDTSVEKADLTSAEATLRQAELAFKRASDLAEKSFGSVATLDQARAARDTAAASVKRVEALIAQKAIRAPFAGKLGIRKVDKGQYASPGQALVSLQQLDPIRADFPMPEQTLARLKPGEDVEVTVDARPGKTYRGKISVLDARVAQETRTLLVRAELPNPDKELLPGMFANVTVLLGEPQRVVTVPRTAVTYSLYGDSVYVVGKAASEAAASTPVAGAAAAATEFRPEPPARDVERRFVKTGETRDDKVAILSGLVAGDEVVTTGQIKLMPGSKVHVENAEQLKPPAVRPRE